MSTVKENFKVMKYEGNDVTFEVNQQTMLVNATEMAKPFGDSKQPIQWLRTENAKDFIDTLSDVRKCSTADLLIVRKGGNPHGQGTWMHEDLAMEFARWLNPRFGIWCNDRIKELLTTGKVELQETVQVNWLPVVLKSEEKRLVARRLYNKSISQKGISEILGISEKTVSAWSKQENWTRPVQTSFVISNIVEQTEIKLPNEIQNSIIEVGNPKLRKKLWEQAQSFVHDLNIKMGGVE